MRVIISGRGLVLTPFFRAQVERKVTRLSRLLPKLLDARVVCEAEKFRRTARLVVRAKRHTFSAEATAADLAAAVDEALEAVDRQIRTAKDRRQRAKAAHTARPRTGLATPPEPTPPKPAPEPVVTRRLVAKPMSVEEAVMQLRLGDEQFFVFRNAQTSDVNVLYRRRDGGLGLVEPVA